MAADAVGATKNESKGEAIVEQKPDGFGPINMPPPEAGPVAYTPKEFEAILEAQERWDAAQKCRDKQVIVIDNPDPLTEDQLAALRSNNVVQLRPGQMDALKAVKPIGPDEPRPAFDIERLTQTACEMVQVISAMRNNIVKYQAMDEVNAANRVFLGVLLRRQAGKVTVKRSEMNGLGAFDIQFGAVSNDVVFVKLVQEKPGIVLATQMPGKN